MSGSPDPVERARSAVQAFAAQLPDQVRNRSQVPAPSDGLVYHYTTMRTVFSMIEPGADHIDNHPDRLRGATCLTQMWATAARYMNDAREFHHGQEAFRKAIGRRRPGAAPADEQILTMMDEAAAGASGIEVYCACLSRHCDHLGQWRGYGDNGRGCALGFDLQKLEDHINGLGFWLVYDDLPGTGASNQQSTSDGLCNLLLESLRAALPESNDQHSDYRVAAQAELERLLPSVLLASYYCSRTTRFATRTSTASCMQTPSHPGRRPSR